MSNFDDMISEFIKERGSITIDEYNMLHDLYCTEISQDTINKALVKRGKELKKGIPLYPKSDSPMATSKDPKDHANATKTEFLAMKRFAKKIVPLAQKVVDIDDSSIMDNTWDDNRAVQKVVHDFVFAVDEMSSALSKVRKKI